MAADFARETRREIRGINHNLKIPLVILASNSTICGELYYY